MEVCGMRKESQQQHSEAVRGHPDEVSPVFGERLLFRAGREVEGGMA